MFPLLASVVGVLRSSFRTRAALQLEIVALRHQINVLRRSQRGRVRLGSFDRLLWTWLRRLWPGWRSALVIVKPETVIALASPGISSVLGLEEPPRAAGKTRVGEGDSGPHSQDEFGQSALGCTANPWGTPQIGDQSVPGDRRQVHGGHTQAAVSELAGFSQQPCLTIGIHGLLRGTDGDLQAAFRFRRACSSPPAGDSLQRMCCKV